MNTAALSSNGSNLQSQVRHSEPDKVARQLRRLDRLYARRPQHPEAANDNQAWPLAQQLRKEGNDVLLRVAERYRAIYDAATADIQLVGTSLGGSDIYSLDERSYAKEDGTVVSLGVRKARPKKEERKEEDEKEGEDETGPNEKKKPVTFKPKQMTRPRTAWNGDAMINAAIDCRGLLSQVQSKLGPLLEVFEEAVLHGETLSSIGEKHGVTPQKSGAAGKAMVMIGLQVAREQFAKYDATVQ